MSTTNICFLQFKIQSYKTWILNAAYAGTSELIPKKKTSKISNITFAILPIYQQQYSNWMAILSTLESTTLDETTRCILDAHLQMVHFRVGNFFDLKKRSDKFLI